MAVSSSPILSSTTEQNLRKQTACGFEWKGFHMGGRLEQRCKVEVGTDWLEGAMVCSEKGRATRDQMLPESPGRRAQAGRQMQTVSGRRYEWENQSGWRH